MLQVDPLEEIVLKIKSIDNQVFEVKVNLTDTINELKIQIEKVIDYIIKITSIPCHRQRLIFKGRALNAEETILSYKLENNATIHLIASTLEQETSPTVQQSMSSIDEHEPLRNDLQESRKQSRRKVLQQRVHGFPNLPNRPPQALQQNVMTLCHIMQSFNNLQESMEQGQIFQQRDFEVGMWVDVKIGEQWVEGQILQKQSPMALVLHKGIEEWVPQSRLAVFRSHTIQKTFHLSPNLQTDQYQFIGFGELLGQCSMLLTRVGEMMGRLADCVDSQPTKNKTDMSTLISGMIEEQRRIQEEKVECKDDVTSLKSMKSMKSDKISLDYETSSIKSMKSDVSKLTQQYFPVHHPSQVRENITEEEEDSQDMSEDQDTKSKDNNIQHYETVLLFAQIAPLADRVGRLLVDLSPYLAISGAPINSISQAQNNISNLSIITNEGSQYSSSSRQYYFQIPILLTPLELQQQQVAINRIVTENLDIVNNQIRRKPSRIDEPQGDDTNPEKKTKKKQKEVSFSQQIEELKKQS